MVIASPHNYHYLFMLAVYHRDHSYLQFISGTIKIPLQRQSDLDAVNRDMATKEDIKRLEASQNVK
jgi:hypothetical protein